VPGAAAILQYIHSSCIKARLILLLLFLFTLRVYSSMHSLVHNLLAHLYFLFNTSRRMWAIMELCLWGSREMHFVQVK